MVFRLDKITGKRPDFLVQPFFQDGRNGWPEKSGRRSCTMMFIKSGRSISMQKKEPEVNKLKLIWRFLKGSKGLFVLSMLMADIHWQDVSDYMIILLLINPPELYFPEITRFPQKCRCESN